MKLAQVIPDGLCELCDRLAPLTAHHKPPKLYVKRGLAKLQLMMLCDDCHRTVHSQFRAKELLRISKEELKTHERLKNYIEWVKRKPLGIVTHSKRCWKGGKYDG
jgi:hypothetical protein